MKTIRINDHVRDCYAVEAVNRGVWNTPWYFPGNANEWRDKNGQNRGSTTHWIKLKCNSGFCDAQLLVLEDDLMDAILEDLEDENA